MPAVSKKSMSMGTMINETKSMSSIQMENIKPYATAQIALVDVSKQ